jgi:hypothetical protein
MALHKNFPDSPHAILDEEGFNKYKPASFKDLITGFVDYK